MTKHTFNLRLQCLLAVALVLLLEPALANKFETIGGGLSGSSGFKREWLQKFFLVVGGASLLGALLAVLVPHRNALFLNYNNWKQSAVMFSVLAAVMFAAAAFI
jgi:hypothetical protein